MSTTVKGDLLAGAEIVLHVSAIPWYAVHSWVTMRRRRGTRGSRLSLGSSKSLVGGMIVSDFWDLGINYGNCNECSGR